MKMLATNLISLANRIFHRVQDDSQWAVPLLIETCIENSTKEIDLQNNAKKKDYSLLTYILKSSLHMIQTTHYAILAR